MEVKILIKRKHQQAVEGFYSTFRIRLLLRLFRKVRLVLLKTKFILHRKTFPSVFLSLYMTDWLRLMASFFVSTLLMYLYFQARLKSNFALNTGSAISFGPVIKATFPKVCYCKQQNNLC